MSVFVSFDDDDGDAFAVVVVASFVLLSRMLYFHLFGGGDFFFLTWVHPSSFLSGWSLSSGCDFSFVSRVIALIVFVVVVGSVTVFVVVF